MPRKDGPGVAVGGIEEVEGLPVEEAPAAGVEGLGVRLSERLDPLPGRLGDARVDGLGRRREEVALLGPHLVDVHVDLRRERAERGEACARLGLRRPGPVPVEVDAEVVRPSGGPRRLVLEGVRVGVGLVARDGAPPGDVPLVPVGVGARVDDDDEGGEKLLDPALARGGEGVEEGGAGLGARGLVAVDAAGDPDDGGRTLDDGAGRLARGPPRVAEALQPGRDGVEAREVLRAGDDDAKELASLGSRAVGGGRDARRRGLEGVHVADEVGVRRQGVADPVAEDGGRKRDFRVAFRLGEDGPRGAAARGEDRVVRGGAERGRGEGEEGGEEEPHAGSVSVVRGGRRGIMPWRLSISLSVVGERSRRRAASFCTPPARCIAAARRFLSYFATVS